MRTIAIPLIVLAFVITAVGTMPTVYAADIVDNTGVRLVNPLGTTDVKSFLLSILGIVTDTIGPVIVILMLVYVGFLFVTAQGNSTKISAAREMLLWTVVGALILLGAKAIALGIQATVDALKV